MLIVFYTQNYNYVLVSPKERSSLDPQAELVLRVEQISFILATDTSATKCETAIVNQVVIWYAIIKTTRSDWLDLHAASNNSI